MSGLSTVASEPSAGPLSRILIVDDEPLICTMLQKTLSLDQVLTTTTTRAKEAIDLLEREPFDLLITDINMPEINGLQLAERARTLQPALGIMIMTGYGSFENMAQAIRMGVSDFIIKPFNIDDLRAAVQRALQRQRLQRDNVRLQTLVTVFEYSQAINSTLDLERLYTIVGDLVLREAQAEAVVIAAVDGAGHLRIAQRRGIAAALGGPLHELMQHAFQTNSVQTVQVSGTDENRTIDRLVAVPLTIRDERLGVLVAGGRGGQVSTELLTVIAYQTALAMRNARQFEEVRELDRLKSEFIGIASHELRTPLSLVLGYSSLLRHRLQGHERDMLQHVIDGALRMGDIIEDLVNLRRAEQKQIELNLAEFDLASLLHEIVAEMQPLAASRGVTLHSDVPSAPRLILADRARIEAAIAELVDNGTKFTEAGGLVTVTLRPPDPPQRTDSIIEVRDTGIGIAAYDLGRIFDRFYQTEPSATRLHSGLGLGLTLAKLWIELHGGSISVQSRPQQGSVFKIRLPSRPPHVPV